MEDRYFQYLSPFSPRYQLRERLVAFPATTKIMIGHRLGHLNFTLYRKQRRPPNHGVNVNDARIRKPFRRTRKLNDNDILHRRCAKYLFDSRTFYFFFSLCPFSSSPLSLWFQLRNFTSFSSSLLPPPPFFHIFVSVLRSFGRCVFCSVKILVNSNHDSRVLYRVGADFSLFPGLNKSLEVGWWWPSAS